jgi:putative ABC transport system permease protein
MNLASKDIRHSFGRFALTTLGIGMLLMVVMGMGGIYRGIESDATLLVDRIGADIWIVQRDTRGPFAEVSNTPPNLLYRVASVPGLVNAREFVYHTVQRDHAGKVLRMAVLGLSWPTDKGAWLPLIAGRPLKQNHYEMLADKSLGLHLGERLRLGKNTYTVVGITSDMIGSSGDGIIFVTVADAQAIQFDTPGEAVRLERAARAARGGRSDLGAQQPQLLSNADLPANENPALATPQISAVIASVAPGYDVKDIEGTIAGWGDVSTFSHLGQRELLMKGTVDKVRRQIGLIRVLLTVVAAIVMALILYTLTLDKLHSIALLKLIGAPNTVILGLILQQALFLGVLGYLIAYLIGQKIFPMFPRRVILTQFDVIMLGVIVLIISVVSSLLGIVKALRVSPNEAIG